MSLRLILGILIFGTCSHSFSKHVLLFVHGGPGSNSAPEAKIFEHYASTYDFNFKYWNEPSTLRGANTPANFRIAVASLVTQMEKLTTGNQRISLIGHSFGTRYILAALKRFNKNIDKIVFLTPIFNLSQGDKNLLKIALEDYKENDEKKFKELKFLMRKMKNNEFDSYKKDAYLLAAHSQKLAQSYWSESDKAKEYMSYQVNRFSFDFKNFLHIRQTAPYEMNFNKIKNKTLLIFGQEDPVISRKKEISTAKKIFPDFETYTLTGRHYLHIEKIQDIFLRISQFLNK